MNLCNTNQHWIFFSPSNFPCILLIWYFSFVFLSLGMCVVCLMVVHPCKFTMVAQFKWKWWVQQASIIASAGVYEYIVHGLQVFVLFNFLVLSVSVFRYLLEIYAVSVLDVVHNHHFLDMRTCHNAKSVSKFDQLQVFINRYQSWY